MERPALGNTYRYKLNPAPEPERRDACWRRGVSVTSSEQKAEAPALNEVMPASADGHPQVLQDVVRRLDRAFQAFFQRLRDRQTLGSPRFHGRDRYRSFTSPPNGAGAPGDGGVLSLSKIGRIRIRVHRPLGRTPKPIT